MEKYFELEQITLIPAVTNVGFQDNKLDITVTDRNDRTFNKSYPIFTAPTKAIVGEENVKVFTDNGIKPVLSREENINLRLNFCKWVFCAFSMSEINTYFLKESAKFRGTSDQYHVCIETGNGHDQRYLSLCSELKRIYGQQILVMGGNIGCAEAFSDYAKSGFDYIRVGIGVRSTQDRKDLGVCCPLGSLLDSIKQFRKTGAIGLPRQPKIIADGSISCFSDIVKAIALGADYVMIGRAFSRVLEAYEVVYKEGEKDKKLIELRPEQLASYSGAKARLDGLKRHYYGPVNLERSSVIGRLETNTPIWQKVDCTLAEWIEEFRICASYNLMMQGAINWDEFKTRVRYGAMSY